jgi:hypothetical protein
MRYRNNQAIIISKLREYNQWRRGDDEIKQPDPFEIGAYIDDICDIAENLERQFDEASDRIVQLLNEKEEAIQQSMRDARRADANATLCSKLCDIAEKAIIPLECDGVPWGAKLRAELEQLKEGAK